jgi:hypothetical protein
LPPLTPASFLPFWAGISTVLVSLKIGRILAPLKYKFWSAYLAMPFSLSFSGLNLHTTATLPPEITIVSSFAFERDELLFLIFDLPKTKGIFV